MLEGSQVARVDVWCTCRVMKIVPSPRPLPRPLLFSPPPLRFSFQIRLKWCQFLALKIKKIPFLPRFPSVRASVRQARRVMAETSGVCHVTAADLRKDTFTHPSQRCTEARE